MTRHLLTSTRFDFEVFRRRKASDEGPEHVAERLAADLDAVIHQPGDVVPGLLDRVLARGFATPEAWAVARSVVAAASPGDLVYATGHDIGLAFAFWNFVTRSGALPAVYYTAPDRPRERWLTEFLTRAGSPLLAVTGTVEKVDFLTSRFGGRLCGVVLADEQTDVEFFRPRADARPERPERRPLVVSAGLEQRDYRTLAVAVGSLDADIKICAVSPNFTEDTRVAMPATMPDSMEMRRFEFDELRTLYQDADVTVIPLLDNPYSAGLTVLMEASACASPVVMSRTPGLAERFIDDHLIIGVDPGDVPAMEAAIASILSDPAEARAMADRARSRILERHTSGVYVANLLDALRRYETEHSP